MILKTYIFGGVLNMLNKSTTQLLKELENFNTFEEYENANRD